MESIVSAHDSAPHTSSAEAAGLCRLELIEELHRRFGSGRPSTPLAAQRLRLYWKRCAWMGVVGGAKALKRTLDMAVSTAMMLALIPLFAAVALAIKLEDGGPILFWQVRVGRWGREFAFPKFRSMVANAEAIREGLLSDNHHGLNQVTFKMKGDPRITRTGRFLRRFSVDELPQLWCVLMGDMSMVGPRPPLPSEVALYKLAERRRLDVTPGITCTWQVSGRGDIPFPQQVEFDVQYVESQNFWLDLLLLWKTIPAVLLGKGAY
jgi:lipopolysaccharide/colanic/teichoic acid biosynthesis glycosyltransferase